MVKIKIANIHNELTTTQNSVTLRILNPFSPNPKIKKIMLIVINT